MPVLDHPSRPTHETPGATFTTLASPSRGTTSGCVWRLHLQPGEPPNPHRLTHEEIFVATAGIATGRIGDEPFTVRAGQTLVVPADVEFEISATADGFDALVYFPVDGKGIIGDGEPFTPPWAL
jgi:quercetin dioxygenase-like cupin family protein